MTQAAMPTAVQTMIDARTVTADDVLTLRRLVYQNGQIEEVEADWMFALNDSCQNADPAWDVLFVEALTDYCVHQMEPRGYVGEANALWLMTKIAADGRIETARELELAVSILQKATSSPESLGAFVLKAVRDEVLSGSGPLRGRQKDFRPRVCAQDVSVLQRAIFAFGAGGNIAVTRAEAEMLCDINDATTHAANDPGWPDLFARAIANHLMMAATFVPADRETAAAREAWLDDQGSDAGRFLGKVAASLKDIFNQKDPAEEFWAAKERQRAEAIRNAAPVDEAEALWLTERLGRDGHFSPAEQALLRFIKTDGAPVHSALQPLLNKVA